jgi:hypothetical protein
MRHALHLSQEARISAWLDLCDLTFRLMKSSLGEKTLEQRLKRMRREQEQANRRLLVKLSRAGK